MSGGVQAQWVRYSEPLGSRVIYPRGSEYLTHGLEFHSASIFGAKPRRMVFSVIVRGIMNCNR